MKDDWKYVILDSSLGGEYPVIFPPFIDHYYAKFFPGKQVSAGFVGVDAYGKLSCYGESETINLKSRYGQDDYLINKLLAKE